MNIYHNIVIKMYFSCSLTYIFQHTKDHGYIFQHTKDHGFITIYQWHGDK